MRVRLSYYKRDNLPPDETHEVDDDTGWVSTGWIDAADRRKAVRIVEARTGVEADNIRIDAVEE